MIEKAPFAALSIAEKVRHVVSEITVEPMFAMYTIAWSISMLAMQNLNLDKACRVNLGFNDTVCSAMLAKNETDNYCERYFELKENMTDPVPWKSMLCDTENAVQGAVTTMGIWKTFLQSLVPALLIPFIGSWTDRRRRRKPAMLVPITGEIVTLCGFMICTYFFYQLPMEVSGITEAFFPSITGGWMTMYMAVFSYMGDITSVQSRTLRIGIVNLCNSVSATVGVILSGILYQKIHYYGVFCLSGILHILAFICGCKLVKGGPTQPPEETDKAKSSMTAFEEEVQPGLIPFLKDFFDYRHIVDMLQTTFKKGEHNHRTRVILLMLVVIVVLGPWQADRVPSSSGVEGARGVAEGDLRGQSRSGGCFKMVGKKEPFSQLSVLDKARYVWEHMTVEPMLAWYTIGYIVSGLAMQNLNLEKACRVNLKFNSTVCDALEARETANYADAEEAVQEAVTSMAIWKTFLQSFIPALLIPFIGAWTDRRRRRKPAMLLPITGEIMTIFGFIMCTYFFYQLPMEVSGITEAFFPAITGGWMTMYMAVFSYMGDITSVENRTLRIGIVNLCSSISIPIGTLLSGFLYKLIGFYGVFFLSTSIHMLSFMYGYHKVQEEGLPPASIDPNTKSVTFEDEIKPGIIPFIIDFFNFHHISDTIRVAFKSGAHNQRLRVILLMVVVIVVSGPWQGEMTVMYNFTRLRFNWNEVDYSIFLTFVMVINLIGTAITVGIFSHMMKMDDAIIGIISCVSKILAGFIYAFAKTKWMIYLAPIVDIANGTSYIAMRSIASKLVPPDELGKLNSVFGMAEAIVPVIYAPMYNAIYNETRQTLPGAFFLIGGALTAPAVFIFLWLYGQHKQDAAREAKNGFEMEKKKGVPSQDETNCDNDKVKNVNNETVTSDSSKANEGYVHDNQNSKL